MSKRPRIIGTSVEAISKSEKELNFNFPASFCKWLIENNGLGVDAITIIPVFDERDPRKTFDSIVRNYKVNWLTWLRNFEGETNFKHLLPFAESGTGDFYCFDYNQVDSDNEPPVVYWSHETGKTKFRAKNFQDYIERLKRGEFEAF